MRKLALLDICLPDYFSGYHLPVFAIPMHDGITFEDVANEIESEFNMEYDYFMSINYFSDEDEKLIHQFVSEYKSKGSEIFYKDADDCVDADYDECPYAYFSIVDPKVINGITFLS